MSVAWIGEIERGPGAFFVISGTEDRDRLDQHRATVDAAAGVERIVHLSFVAAAPETTFTFGQDR
jgi:NAD(P)H dehydrogenase (quinone)